MARPDARSNDSRFAERIRPTLWTIGKGDFSGQHLPGIPDFIDRVTGRENADFATHHQIAKIH
ncbi:hypothetical protein [Paraburkholderia bannensis]|uniref:hypothetical protein n=1 Tax=Paraburkholderia bannensis TaxID=765414 RepID=UPI0012EB706A|nr:hypothetical protein [Paraburkholderia bannensis]